MKAREIKRAKLVAKYAEKRAALKQIVRTGDPAEAFDAAQKLQEQQLPSDNTAPFCELVSAVNFGGATPSAEACAAAEQALQQLAEAIYQAKSPLQKLYFKYIQHLI